MRHVTRFPKLTSGLLILCLLAASATGCQSLSSPGSAAPTAAPATALPPTAAPPAAPPPTAVAPVAAAPTAIPPTAVPPTVAPPTANVPPTPASATLTVSATDTIYLAGRDDVTILDRDTDVAAFQYPLLRCGGDLIETWPQQVAVAAGASLTFKATGTADFYGSAEPAIEPDGEADSEGGIEPLGGISAYWGPNGALVGVFLGGANPAEAEAPEPLDFSAAGLGADYAELTPALGQVFFIGDGLTGHGSGATQRVIAPVGAKRLFLGTADASMFWGPPGCYEDNVGAYQVIVTGALAQGGTSAPGGQAGASGTQATVAPGAVAPTAAQPVATTRPAVSGGQATPSGTASGGATAGGDNLLGLEAVALDDLDSYRSRIEITSGEQGQEETVSVLEQEWVRATASRRTAFSTGGTLIFETITIGNQTWTHMPPMAWQLTPESADNMAGMMGGAMSVDEMLDADAARVAQGAESGIRYEGQETVNDVRCRRYAVSLEMDDIGAAMGQAGAAATLKDYVATGKVWVADEAGLPKVTVRTTMDSTYTLDGQAGSVSMVMDVTDINQPITIEPPM